MGGWYQAVWLFASALMKRPPIRPPEGCGKGSTELQALKIVERVKGIEPSLSAWETIIGVMPSLAEEYH